jgi:hypothetical protein
MIALILTAESSSSIVWGVVVAFTTVVIICSLGVGQVGYWLKHAK